MFAGIDHLGLFIAAGLLLNLTPGPDVLYIVGNGLRGGWRGGAVAALGITAGCFVHVAAATVGLSALIAASATAFTVLKWIGAAYLVYVGIGMLLARSHAGASERTGSAPLGTVDPQSLSAAGRGKPRDGTDLRKVFLQGFWTNALNPKVALFFLAFVPQFIAPAVENKPLAFLLLGLLFNFNGLWVNIGWALAAAWLAGRANMVQKSMHRLDRIAGAMFVGFGIKLALTAAPKA